MTLTFKEWMKDRLTGASPEVYLLAERMVSLLDSLSVEETDQAMTLVKAYGQAKIIEELRRVINKEDIK